MIDISTINKVYVFSGVTDFRYGINALAAIVQSKKNEIPLENHNLYVFCNKKRTHIKILEFDETGIWLYQKKLNNTRFIYPDAMSTNEITKDDLKIILEGLNFISKINGTYNQKYTFF